MKEATFDAKTSKSSEDQNMQSQWKSTKKPKCKEAHVDNKKYGFEICLNTKNRFDSLDIEPDSIDARIEAIKAIKPRDRTTEQKKELKALYQ